LKSKLFSQSGELKSEIELPKVFSSKIRQDMVMKYLEVEKFKLRQPYSNFEEAGKRHSASGTISHKRHEWKGHYGKGISRAPRKTMWRRGTQFYWVGAEVSNARGGRIAHNPTGIYSSRKINKKEINQAMSSALAATANKEIISSRYSSISKIEVSAPVIESLPSKTQELVSSIKKIFGDEAPLLRKKAIRSGKGKKRGRRFKSNAGLLIIASESENLKSKIVEIKSYNQINIKDLYPLGRLTLYTKKALEELQNVA
jgi:large subunit ribosomal protein L4e